MKQQVTDLLLAVLLPRVVDDDAGRPDDVPVGVVPRRHLEGQPELPSGAGRVGALEEALVALDGQLDRLEELTASLERRDGLAAVVVGGRAEDLLERRVAVEEDEVAVEDEHPDR